MPKRALIVQGGWDGHTPKESAAVFAPLLEAADYHVTVSDTLDSYLDESLMASLDLILPIWTMGKITNDQWKALNNTVYAGTGYAGFHGGIIDSFRENTDYQFMTGGQWVAHPGNVIPSYDVLITDHTHPITSGLTDFTLTNTEQYYVHTDPANHVLCSTTFSGEHGDPARYRPGTVMPYAWTRTWGQGKIFVACWGHTYADFDNDTAKEFVRRGLLWASR